MWHEQSVTGIPTISYFCNVYHNLNNPYWCNLDCGHRFYFALILPKEYFNLCLQNIGNGRACWRSLDHTVKNTQVEKKIVVLVLQTWTHNRAASCSGVPGWSRGEMPWGTRQDGWKITHLICAIATTPRVTLLRFFLNGGSWPLVGLLRAGEDARGFPGPQNAFWGLLKVANHHFSFSASLSTRFSSLRMPPAGCCRCRGQHPLRCAPGCHHTCTLGTPLASSIKLENYSFNHRAPEEHGCELTQYYCLEWILPHYAVDKHIYMNTIPDKWDCFCLTYIYHTTVCSNGKTSFSVFL